jgi:hypothetical protein
MAISTSQSFLNPNEKQLSMQPATAPGLTFPLRQLPSQQRRLDEIYDVESLSCSGASALTPKPMSN